MATIWDSINSLKNAGSPDVFSRLFQQGAPQQYGLYYTSPGTEGPNTPEWVGEDQGALQRLQPYMNMSGADLQANWGSLPADIKAKLGNTPEEFAKKVSYAPDGQGGWTNTFVEKGEGLGDYILPALIAGVGGLGVGLWGPGAAAAGAGAGAAGAGLGAVEEAAGLGGWLGAGGTPIAPGALAGAGGAAFDPTADLGADYFSGAENYTGSGTFGTAPGSVDYSSPLTDAPSGLQSVINQAKNIPGGSSVLSKIFNGTADAGDWASAAGELLATGLGIYGSNQQANSLESLANKYQEYGAPSRARYEASMSPGFDPTTIPGYSGALDTASKGILARLSATGGNPFGNPGGLIEANKQIVAGTALPAINEYQRMNANTGFGQSMNAALNLQTQGIGADANGLNALGYGLNALTSQQPKQQSLADLYRSLGLGGLA